MVVQTHASKRHICGCDMHTGRPQTPHSSAYTYIWQRVCPRDIGIYDTQNADESLQNIYITFIGQPSRSLCPDINYNPKKSKQK